MFRWLEKPFNIKRRDKIPKFTPKSDYQLWAAKKLEVLVPIFTSQGYTQAKVSKLIRGHRHLVIPITPSLYDISNKSNLHSELISLSKNIGIVTGTGCYAEWVGRQIFYYLELPPRS